VEQVDDELRAGDVSSTDDPVTTDESIATTHEILGPVGTRRIRTPVFVIGLVAVLGVLLLMGDAIFFGDDGASSPEGAVQRLADAVTTEDMVGALSAMAPDEVRAIATTYTTAADKARELGVTGQGTFSWVDLNIDGLRLKTEQLGPDVARVSIAGGKLTAQTHTDQLGDKAKELGGSGLQKFATHAKPATVQASDLKWRPSGDDGPKRDPFLVAVRRDGGWYVSPFYTAAEYLMANAASTIPRPDYGEIKPGPAAPTPSAAVQQLVGAINDRNVDHGIESLSAGEWAVLRTYRGAIEKVIGDAVKDATDGDFHIDDVKLTEKKLDDARAVVTIASFRAHAMTSTSDTSETSGMSDSSGTSNTFDSSGTADTADPTGTTAAKERVDVSYDGKCLKVTRPSEDPFDSCAKSVTAGRAMAASSSALTLEENIGPVLALEQKATSDVGIVTVAERGGWAISPMETVFGALTKFVEALTPDDLVAITGKAAEQPAQFTMAVGETRSVKLNGAGFAVVGLKVHQGDLFTVRNGQVYSSSGKQIGVPLDALGSDSFASPDPSLFNRSLVSVERDAVDKVVVRGPRGGTAEVRPVRVEIGTLAVGRPAAVRIDPATGVALYSVPVTKGQVLSVTASDGLDAGIRDESGVTGSESDGYEASSTVLVAGKDETRLVAVLAGARAPHGEGTVTVSNLQPTVIPRGVPVPVSVTNGRPVVLASDALAGDSANTSGDMAGTTMYDADGQQVEPVMKPGRVTIVVETFDLSTNPKPFTLTVGPVGDAGSFGAGPDTPVTANGFSNGETSMDVTTDDLQDGELYDWVDLVAGQGGTVVFTPVAGVDAELGVACADDEYDDTGDPKLSNDAPAGAPETHAIAPQPGSQECDIAVDFVGPTPKGGSSLGTLELRPA
jgi:hypothetical protein